MSKMIKINAPEDLIKALKKTRKSKKISQAELGGFANITTATISRIENEETDPQISTVLRLAKLLNLNIYIQDSQDE
ncbi:MAG: helix-turn-helix transcriptional regulator [Pseudobdellovibrio sp.]